MGKSDTSDNLPRWPYDWQTAENQLDPSVIVEQGEFLLNRALNTRRVIGFVGSGVSAAYGRVTWTELALFHIDRLLRFFPGGNADPDIDPPFESNDPRRNIWLQLHAMRERKCDKGRTVLLALQLCEQMWCLSPDTHGKEEHKLKHLCDIFNVTEHYDQQTILYSRQPERGRDLFRFWVKRETHDELPHVLRVLAGTPIGENPRSGAEFQRELADFDRHQFEKKVQEKEKVQGGAKLNAAEREELRSSHPVHSVLHDLTQSRKLTRASAENPKRGYAELFTPPVLEEMLGALRDVRNEDWFAKSSLADPLLDEAEALLEAVKGAAAPLSPIRYFSLGLALDLVRLAANHLGSARVACIVFGLLERALARSDPGTRKTRTRSQTIDTECDPLHRMVYDLQFKRFATTNYDLEIERFFFDLGFQPAEFELHDDAPQTETVRVGSAGARTRDIVLNEGTTVDLLDFATDDSRYAMEVVHLHGRATEDSEILITERDYQITYLREGHGQQTFRQGLDITFGGNPVLFVGQGMSEGDVLRPLREFVSMPSRRNRSVIALRDSQEDKVTRDAFTMEQFAKYGAHIIHFGFLTDADGKLKDVKRSSVGPDGKQDDSWLFTIVEMVRRLQEQSSSLSAAWEDAARTARREEGATNALALVSPEGRAQALAELHQAHMNADSAAKKAEKARDDLIAVTRKSIFRDAIGFGLDFLDLHSDGGPLKVEFELCTLERLRHLMTSVAVALPTGVTGGVLDFFKEIVPVALERIKASFLTIALNAKLEGLRKDWLNWWNEWREIPADRSLFMAYRRMKKHEDVSLWGRHVAQIAEPGFPEEQFYPPSFRYPQWLPPTPDDRRCMVLTAPKGYGKGYLFSFLASTLKISEARGDRRRYLGQFYHSFSFATEIASVWDALPVFLAAPKEFPVLDDKEQFERSVGIEPSDFIQMSRVERLEWALARLENLKRSRSSNRVLIAFNAADILFDEFGNPKHPEIEELLDRLLSDEHKDAPLDIIFSVRDTRFPAWFQRERIERHDRAILGRQKLCRMPLRLLLPDGVVGNEPLDIAAAQHVAETAKRANVNLIGFDPPPLSANRIAAGGSHVNTATERHFLYVLPEPRPQHFLRAAPDGNASARPGAVAGAKPGEPVVTTTGIGVGSADAPNEPASDQSGATAIAINPSTKPRPVVAPDDITKAIAAAVDSKLNLAEATEKQIFDSAGKFLSNRLGSSSYAFTIIRAIAKELLDRKGEGHALSKDDIDELRRAIDPIFLEAETSKTSPPTDNLYAHVLDFWYRYEAKRPCENPELLELLLRHIAVIAGPVDAEVLAQCPLVAERVAKICGKERTAIDENELVADALNVLVQRRLVLQIEPHELKRDSSENGRHRYQVHRSIQTHIYRKLGSQSAEPSESYLFAPSLYVARTRSLPRLHASSYKFLYELVDNLISYRPRLSGQTAENRSYREAPLHAKSLRAALGVVRTLFSLGIVTRFADANVLPVPKPPQVGYLEHHRLAIRWMLKFACWLEKDMSAEPIGVAAPIADASEMLEANSRKSGPRRLPEWPPFYRDEIVWLYNECGVFSLAQGQCYDARALFEQALREQTRIDGIDQGAMRHRILFNAALCAIDRGGLRYARGAFNEIIRAANAEPLMQLLAQAFTAHVAHISGQVDTALAGFAETMPKLEKLHQLRPLALLLCHRGDLHRQRGDTEAALRDFHAAAEHACAGSYADLIHYAHIGAVRTRVGPRRTTSEIQEAMHKLQAAEDYADRMDLPRLKCEVMLIRGEVQINQGEMTLAGQLVTRAVRIANLNGLALRRLAGLQLLAEIHRAGGDSIGANRLKSRIAQAAQDIGYHLLVAVPIDPASGPLYAPRL